MTAPTDAQAYAQWANIVHNGHPGPFAINHRDQRYVQEHPPEAARRHLSVIATQQQTPQQPIAGYPQLSGLVPSYQPLITSSNIGTPTLPNFVVLSPGSKFP